MRFRSKVVEIDAWQFTGGACRGAPEWLGDVHDERNHVVAGGDGETLCIATLEGTMTASMGDWIIRGLRGEFYPCKPDVFAMKYEPVNFSTPVHSSLSTNPEGKVND